MKRYIVSIPYPGGIMSAVSEVSNQEKLFETIVNVICDI